MGANSKSWSDNLVDIFGGVKKTASGVFSEASKIRTVVDDFMGIFGASERNTVAGTPRAGYPEGRNNIYYNQEQPGGADVTNMGAAYGRAFIDQVKGLFNPGYDSPQGSQPVANIPTAAGGLTASTILIGAALIFGVIFLSRRK